MIVWLKCFGMRDCGVEFVDGLIMFWGFEVEYFFLVGGMGVGKMIIMEMIMDGVIVCGD